MKKKKQLSYLSEEKQMHLMMVIGKIVMQKRVECGIDLDTLCQKYGLSNDLVIGIEHAVTEPTVDTLLKLAHAFGMKCGQLIVLIEDEMEKCGFI